MTSPNKAALRRYCSSYQASWYWEFQTGRRQLLCPQWCDQYGASV